MADVKISELAKTVGVSVDKLLSQIKEILEMNEVDLIWIPRVNTVDGFTEEDAD